MIGFKRMKGLAILLSICMTLGILHTNVYADDGSGDMGASGVVEEIYVGGPNALMGNDGSLERPYVTLKEAADKINSKTSGSYEIIMLGDTTETSSVVFGNGGDIDVSMTADATSSGAITVSKGFNSGNGSMICVNINTTLTVKGSSDLEQLIFDGQGESFQGEYPLVMVMANGTLNLNANTYVQNNVNTRSNTSYQGGGIINYGTLNINGGNVSNNKGYNAGGIFNNGTLTMNDGSVSFKCLLYGKPYSWKPREWK